MIKIEVFDREDPITVIGEGTISDFVEWTNRSKIVGVVEKDTDALFMIPVLKYPLKITELDEEQCDCENCDKEQCDCEHCNEEDEE